MNRFIVFDVETPNHLNDRMSAIGITIIEDDRIVDSFYSLVNPETYFDSFNKRLTGIDEFMVANAPSFDLLWENIEPLFSSGMIVAHNATFDMDVLKKCLAFYHIDWKPYVHYICTVQMGRVLLPGISHKLNDLCDYYDICLNHHRADSDSNACANILLRYLESGADTSKFIRTCKLL